MPRERRSRRRGGGASRREDSATKAPAYIKRKIPYYEVLNEEELSIIEHNSETIL